MSNPTDDKKKKRGSTDSITGQLAAADLEQVAASLSEDRVSDSSDLDATKQEQDISFNTSGIPSPDYDPAAVVSFVTAVNVEKLDLTTVFKETTWTKQTPEQHHITYTKQEKDNVAKIDIYEEQVTTNNFSTSNLQKIVDVFIQAYPDEVQRPNISIDCWASTEEKSKELEELFHAVGFTSVNLATKSPISAQAVVKDKEPVIKTVEAEELKQKKLPNADIYPDVKALNEGGKQEEEEQEEEGKLTRKRSGNKRQKEDEGQEIEEESNDKKREQEVRGKDKETKREKEEKEKDKEQEKDEVKKEEEQEEEEQEEQNENKSEESVFPDVPNNDPFSVSADAEQAFTTSQFEKATQHTIKYQVLPLPSNAKMKAVEPQSFPDMDGMLEKAKAVVDAAAELVKPKYKGQKNPQVEQAVENVKSALAKLKKVAEGYAIKSGAEINNNDMPAAATAAVSKLKPELQAMDKLTEAAQEVAAAVSKFVESAPKPQKIEKASSKAMKHQIQYETPQISSHAMSSKADIEYDDKMSDEILKAATDMINEFNVIAADIELNAAVETMIKDVNELAVQSDAEIKQRKQVESHAKAAKRHENARKARGVDMRKAAKNKRAELTQAKAEENKEQTKPEQKETVKLNEAAQTKPEYTIGNNNHEEAEIDLKEMMEKAELDKANRTTSINPFKTVSDAVSSVTSSVSSWFGFGEKPVEKAKAAVQSADEQAKTVGIGAGLLAAKATMGDANKPFLNTTFAQVFQQFNQHPPKAAIFGKVQAPYPKTFSEQSLKDAKDAFERISTLPTHTAQKPSFNVGKRGGAFKHPPKMGAGGGTGKDSLNTVVMRAAKHFKR